MQTKFGKNLIESKNLTTFSQLKALVFSLHWIFEPDNGDKDLNQKSDDEDLSKKKKSEDDASLNHQY